MQHCAGFISAESLKMCNVSITSLLHVSALSPSSGSLHQNAIKTTTIMTFWCQLLEYIGKAETCRS